MCVCVCAIKRWISVCVRGLVVNVSVHMPMTELMVALCVCVLAFVSLVFFWVYQDSGSRVSKVCVE